MKAADRLSLALAAMLTPLGCAPPPATPIPEAGLESAVASHLEELNREGARSQDRCAREIRRVASIRGTLTGPGGELGEWTRESFQITARETVVRNRLLTIGSPVQTGNRESLFEVSAEIEITETVRSHSARLDYPPVPQGWKFTPLDERRDSSATPQELPSSVPAPLAKAFEEAAEHCLRKEPAVQLRRRSIKFIASASSGRWTAAEGAESR